MRCTSAVFLFLAIFAMSAASVPAATPAAIGCLDVSSIWAQAAATTDPARRTTLDRQKQIIEDEFPFTEVQALAELNRAYPQADYPMLDDDAIAQWLHDERTTCAVIDGQKRYFEGIVNNLAYRNFEVSRLKLKKAMDGASPFVDQVRELVFPRSGAGIPGNEWQSYTAPVRYLVELRLDLARSKLPKAGSVRVWMPLPVTTASQQNVRLVSIHPAKWLVARPRVDGQMGMACFDVPLDGLEADLSLQATLLLDSYGQAFRVDPAKVQPYRTEGADYQAYTLPGPNIAITPGIAARAKAASGGEQNPFLAARSIYRHILQNVRYSLTPHGTLMILGIPESLWVHQRGFGDCGAQSMYMAALCRSLGIPARATGGFQLFPALAGTHFWAEVYIEGYGWIPLDPTVADAADWTGSISEDERRSFKSFYFGNLDPFRLVVQKDVDVAPVPSFADNWLTGSRPIMVMQQPWLDCPSCKANPLELVNDGFIWKATPLDH